jgi:hypothetical protein
MFFVVVTIKVNIYYIHLYRGSVKLEIKLLTFISLILKI